MATPSSSSLSGPSTASGNSSLNTVTMSYSVEVVDLSSECGGTVRQPQSESEAEAVVGEEAAGASGGGEGGDVTETIARGITPVLGPVVRIFETRVEEVLNSQSTLQSSVDRLTRELDKLLEDTPLPLGAQHAAKLSGIRKRVGSLIETLRIIQGRISNMDCTLSSRSVGSLH